MIDCHYFDRSTNSTSLFFSPAAGLSHRVTGLTLVKKSRLRRACHVKKPQTYVDYRDNFSATLKYFFPKSFFSDEKKTEKQNKKSKFQNCPKSPKNAAKRRKFFRYERGERGEGFSKIKIRIDIGASTTRRTYQKSTVWIFLIPKISNDSDQLIWSRKA